MSDLLKEIQTQEAFHTEVLDQKLPILVDFWAPWCGPCRTLGPILETFAKKNIGKIKIVKINVDDAPELAAQYSIRSIPALKFFKDGQIVEEKVGVVSEHELQKILDKHS